MRRYLAFVALMSGPALIAADSAAARINRFSTASYRELAPAPGNLIYSPFSISSAVSMVLAGARGSTASGIATALGERGINPAYHTDLAALVDQLIREANTGGGQLSIANALWVQSGLPLEAAFRNVLSSQYKAPLTQLDFFNPERCRVEINSWTEQQTKGKIRDLFAPGVLKPSTRLVLTSAIYFKGAWQSPFQTQQTKPAPFRTGTRGTVQADFMNQTAHFGYAEVPGLQVLEMKYGGTPLAFDALLPKGDDLKSLENSLSPENLAKWFAELGDRKVQVALPRFRAESEFSLKEMLSRMGMESAFTGSADLSGIDGKRDLQISDVVHKAFVEVTEEGTVAAAATGAAISLTAMRQEPPTPVFRADHPFVFLIRDTRSGAILFAGRVMNPKV